MRNFYYNSLKACYLIKFFLLLYWSGSSFWLWRLATFYYNSSKACFLNKFFLLFSRAEALFDFAHPWAQPFGRPSFGIRPIRLSPPNCGYGPLAAL